MSHIWIYSPSSAPLLQRVLEVASRDKSANRWKEKFGKETSILCGNNSDLCGNNTEIISPIQEENITEGLNNEDFFESLENDNNLKLDYILEKCTRNPDLITKMSEKLSNAAVEKLFELIFSEKDIENVFTEQFLVNFYPQYVKNQYSMLCVDLLVKINEINSKTFLKLLQILFNREINSNLLNSYIMLLKNEELTLFLENLEKIEINNFGFVNNLLTIYTAFKECIKNDRTQSFIKNCLVNFGNCCKSDRNYGRLFLLYLQTEKNMERLIDVEILEKCLDEHCSPFKKPCLNLLNELKE